MYLLKNGNLKLSRNIGIWTLPRTTCIGKGDKCDKYCYAKTFEKMSQVNKYRNYRLELSKSKLFEKQMIKELKNSYFKYIRLHESGDFYNQEYLDKWKRIAKCFPSKIFLAYTKSLTLDLWNGLPRNFIIFQSYDGKQDNLIDENKNTARVIKSINQLRDNEYLCKYQQSDFTKCGECCTKCFNKNKIKHVAFKLHNKNHKKE